MPDPYRRRSRWPAKDERKTGGCERCRLSPAGYGRPEEGLVADEQVILTVVWTMANTGTLYDDPMADDTRRDPESLKRHAPSQLQRLGYYVVLYPTAQHPKKVGATRGNLRVAQGSPCDRRRADIGQTSNWANMQSVASRI